MKTLRVTIETIDDHGKVKKLAQQWKFARVVPTERLARKVAEEAILTMVSPRPNDDGS